MTDRNKFLIIGAAAGAALGAVLAYTYYQQQTTGLWTQKRENNQTLTVQAGAMDFAKLGMAIFAILRQVQGMTKPRK